ncbi:MAG: tetratricopeptide repeat protein [Proteobacteria bacterium]|nr:tetratricopeptide repeat protein [Pseudomonadota bacterium]
MKLKYGRVSLRVACAVLAGAGLCGCLAGCGGSGTTTKTAAGVASSPVDASGNRVAVKEAAIELFSKGLAIADSDPAQAIRLFTQAAKEDGRFAEAWYNIGLLEQRLGNVSEARAAYEKARQMRPDMAGIYTNLAKMLIGEGKYDEAEALLLKVVDDKTGIEPYNVEANLNLGMIYRRRGEAILERERGGVEPKFNISGNERKGEIENREAYDMFAKAVARIRRALSGDSNNIYSYENLCAIYYMLNQLEVARLVCTQAKLKYEEYNAELKSQLDAGRISKVEFDRKAYTPRDLAVIFNTSGLIYLAEGEVSLGNAEFRSALEFDSNSVSVMLNVAGIAVNVQDYPLAYDLYTRILALEPGNVAAYLSKGVAARGLNRLDEAEKIYRDIIARHPNFPQASFNLAVLYQEYYLKFDEARKMFEDFAALPQAQQIIPGRVEEARLRIKQIDELKEAQRKAEAEQAEMKAIIEENERRARERGASE